MLSNKVIDLLEDNNIRIYNRAEQNGEYYREIEFYSNAGEDFLSTVWYDGTNNGFVEGFQQMAADFDPDEHAELYINMRGTRGVPDSIRTLIDDADEIKNFLIEIAEKLTDCLI